MDGLHIIASRDISKMTNEKVYLKIEPKKPISGNFELMNDSQAEREKLEGFRYLSPLGIRVISSVHIVEKTDGSGVAPHFHISISDNGGRVSSSAASYVLKHFGSDDFEEDNHSPNKIIRSFWKPVEGEAKECPCKENEKPEIHGDYVWREGKHD